MCYTCDHVAHPRDCDRIVECKANEVSCMKSNLFIIPSIFILIFNTPTRYIVYKKAFVYYEQVDYDDAETEILNSS